MSRYLLNDSLRHSAPEKEGTLHCRFQTAALRLVKLHWLTVSTGRFGIDSLEASPLGD